MGVDYYTCENCGNTFPDCGNFFTCSGCEACFCSNTCGRKQEDEIEEDEAEEDDGCWHPTPTTCVLCRLEVIPDSDMVNFLLNKLSLTYEQAEEIYKKSYKENMQED